MIAFHRVSASYQRGDGEIHPVLQALDLRIEQGAFVAIMGRNGSGKTTLARLCNGLILPSAGRIQVDRFAISPENRSDIPHIRRLIGMVFQNPENQLVSTTVEREIAFGLENLGIAHHEMHRRIDAVLHAFDLTKYRQKSPAYLSGGEKQRLALAAVMAMQPAYLILDEPTAMLDYAHKQKLLHTITALNTQKSAPAPTIMLITQDPVEALFAQRLLVLQDGKIMLDGPPRDIFLREKALHELDLSAPIEFVAYQLLRHHSKAAIALDSVLLDPIL